MWVQVVAAIVLPLLPMAAFAQTEKRIALLIGKRDYKAGVGALTNPLNDINRRHRVCRCALPLGSRCSQHRPSMCRSDVPETTGDIQ